MIEKNLELTLQLDKDGYIIVGVYEPESGGWCEIHNVYSPEEHPELDRQVGDEIYSWFVLMADEMEEDDVAMG